MTSALEVRGLVKSFQPGQPVVQEVSFAVEAGEIFVLLGPSGCGKTTTLRMIGGFETPDAGEILRQGAAITRQPPEARGIGFVFQDYALFPHLDVAKNVGYGLRKMPRQQREAKIQSLLSLVGLEGMPQRMPQQLSGGEQQRVALARSLALEPRLLLLDEPFSNLDEKRREAMRVELRQLLKEQGISAVLVTHHQEEALTMADRIGVMHQGSLLQVGTPQELYHAPQTAFVAQFLGHTNLLAAEAHGDTARTRFGELPITPRAEGAVTLSLRPEAIALAAPSDPPKGLTATLLHTTFKGNHTLASIALGETRLDALLPEAFDDSTTTLQVRFLRPAVVVAHV